MIPRFLPETRASNIFKALLRSAIHRHANYETFLRQALIKLCQVDNVILMPSARAGLYWILRALKPPRLYLPAFLCSSVYECALRAGTQMTYLDSKPGSFEVNYEGVEFEPGSVLLLVHQYGMPSDPHEAQRIATDNGLVLIEDNAPSIGATWNGHPVGSFGDASIVSFEYSKTISACKGGAALFNSVELYEKVIKEIDRTNKNNKTLETFTWFIDALNGIVYDLTLMPFIYGSIAFPLFKLIHGPFVDRSQSIVLGDAYHIHFGQGRAELALQMLSRLPEIIEARRHIAEIYKSVLSGTVAIELPATDDNALSAYTHYPVLLKRGAREAVIKKMWSAGIDPGFNFSYLCGGNAAARSAPLSEDYTHRIITLPISSRISDEKAHYIADTLRKAIKQM